MAYSNTTIVGRLTADPNIKSINTKNGEQSVANFSIACNRNFGDATDFYDVVAWRQLAETVGKYLTKGRQVLVSGRMEQRSYTAQTPGGENYERRVWELVANNVEFLDGGQNQNNQNNQQGQQSQGQYGQQPQAENPYYAPMPNDDDIPF